MKKTGLLWAGILLLCLTGEAQTIVPVQRLLDAMQQSEQAGEVFMYQDARIDTLFSRRLAANKKVDGIEGYRIQIYRGSGRRARDEANERKARFLSKFPDAEVYIEFDAPNFKVKVGDFRSRRDGFAFLMEVQELFPYAYMVPDIITYPKLEAKDE